MQQLIIILAGYSGVGKSTIARTLAERHGFGLINHQELVHDLAVSKGFERARHWLAAVGIDQFSRESVQEMVKETKETLEVGFKGVVIDAGYGPDMISLFRENFKGKELVVFGFSAEAEKREERIMGRMETERAVASKEREFRDTFLKEVGLEELLKEADILITNEDDLESVVKEIESHLMKLKINFL